MPLLIPAATPLLRWIISPKLALTSPTEMPYSAEWLIYSKTCALLSNALVGIQPQLRQIPPSSAASMTAVFKPNCEAQITATYPPGPLPTTITSNLVEDILIYLVVLDE